MVLGMFRSKAAKAAEAERMQSVVDGFSDKERAMLAMYKEVRDVAMAESETPDGHLKDKYFKLDADIEARLEALIDSPAETGFSAADIMSFVSRQQRIESEVIGAVCNGKVNIEQPTPL